MKRIFTGFLLVFYPVFLLAGTRFVAELPSPHEYDLFANGGWNGNWYVGYDHCWIEKLPPIPDRDKYEKAFLGARMGRAKTSEQIKKAIEKLVADKKKKLDGATGKEKEKLDSDIKKLEDEKKFADDIKFFVSISTDPDFSNDKKFFLAENSEIPLEGDNNEALDFVGESRWFWTEIPLKEVSDAAPNYVAVWSDNSLLSSVLYAPILAAGWSDSNGKDSFLTTNSKGKKPASCEKIINFFAPAIAIKLVPASKVRKIFVSVEDLKVKRKVLRIRAFTSDGVVRIRMRLFSGDKEIPTGYGILSKPYILTAKNLKSGKYSVFLEATDWDGNFAKSKKENFEIK